MKFVFFIALVFSLTACFKGKSVDLIVHNARIYSMDEGFTIYEAMAIKDGKIVEIAAERQILNKYRATETIDALGKEIFPGFIDAHGHLLLKAEQHLTADLMGSKSMQEVLVRMEKFASRTQKKFLVGRGWDQSLWQDADLPTNALLNERFPNTPVALFRVDVHAVLVNDFLLKQLKIDENTKVDGGIIVVENGKPTGLLTDNAMNAVFEVIPPYSDEEMMNAILEIQNELFQFGITSVHEAGIQRNHIDLFKKLVDSKKFDLHVNAMLMPSEENIAFAQKNGKYTYKNLKIASFKVIGDGALGSRGACLKHPYHDLPGHFGILTTSFLEMQRIAEIARKIDYQMNVHAIGDSTNRLVLDLIAETNKLKKDHRWRIEHAQVLSMEDIRRFAETGAFPSVQPTHAVSDQRWAENRLGKNRLKGAYAYNQLLKQAGMMALGTDFPVESIDPFLTIHAAVHRKNKENLPTDGFLSEDKISWEDCMRGMTIWAAFASFQEDEMGSLEKNKSATFVILNQPIQRSGDFKPNYAAYTFINGKKVYSFE